MMIPQMFVLLIIQQFSGKVCTLEHYINHRPMPSERLLQFIWQFQYFNAHHLYTITGEPLQIVHPGIYNTNQGPDFLQAKIKTGDTLWAGNVELHVRASQWHAHHHSGDVHYHNIVLHVVWINDSVVTDQCGNPLATLELQPLVSSVMLQHYHHLMQHQGFVPCEKHLPVLNAIAWNSWKERLMVERLQQRSAKIFTQLAASNNHWEEVFWWMLARNFGVMVNADAFERIALSIPVNILAKQKSSIVQIEALLLGQAALLPQDAADDYVRLLQREHTFLCKKYNLQPAGAAPVFLRMRPSAFPTVRLAQLAALLFTSEHLFSKVTAAATVQDLLQMLDVTANDYWHYHYRLGEESDYKPKKLGRQMAENIVINTFVPVLFAYGMHKDSQLHKDKATDWLAQLAPESNRITLQWTAKGVVNNNALHSQALLELKKQYCDNKRCLECAIGNKLLKGVAR